jgi:hypothetical protein
VGTYSKPILEGPSNAPLTVPPPTVNIQVESGKSRASGTGFVVLGNENGTTNLTATGTPSGGTFQWSLGPKLAFVGSSTGANVSVRGTSQSATWDDTWVSVTYSVSGANANSSIQFTVRSPRRFLAASYPGGPQYTTGYHQGPNNGYITWITYFVQDQFQANIELGGFSAVENLTTQSVSHSVQFNPPDGSSATGGSDATGSVLDMLYVYGNPGVPSNFSAVRSQNWTVAGYIFTPPQTQTYGTTYALISVASMSW